MKEDDPARFRLLLPPGEALELPPEVARPGVADFGYHAGGGISHAYGVLLSSYL